MFVPENHTPNRGPAHYQIAVKGKINASWSDWFDGMVLVSGRESGGSQVTILPGAIKDQAALRGILIRLWDLNMTLISVQQIDPAADGGIISRTR